MRDARGYRTARTGPEIPPEFSRGLRYGKLGGETLVIPLRSPDGTTTSHLIRHDRPKPDRKGKTRKFLNPGKSPDRPTNILDVPPTAWADVMNPAVPLWITEGPLKGDALASWGRAVITIAGVDNWYLKGGKPLRCWEHVPLDGRLVFVGYDHDHRIKESVQIAEGKLVAFLESKGARVLVVDVPAVDGKDDTGVDDWIGRHGDPEPLERAAVPFVPVDVGRVRVSRDAELRHLSGELWRAVRGLEMRSAGECTNVLVAREYVRAVERHGKLRAGGAMVHPSRRQIAANIGVGLASVQRAVEYLEEIGFMEALDEPRRAHEAASYLVKYPPGGCALSEHIEQDNPSGPDSQEHPRPVSSLGERHLHPGVHSTHIPLTGQTGPPPDLPSLRYPKLVHTWDRKAGRRVVVDSQYFWRYGPKRGEIIRYVLEHGCAERAELHEKFGSKTSRPGRFFDTWVKPMFDDGVFHEPAGAMEMAPDWREVLERVRLRTDEDGDNRRQRERYDRNRAAFRERLEAEKRGEAPKPEPVPELAGRGRVAEIFAADAERDHAARVEGQRRKAGTTAAVFISDALEGVSGFGWRELGDLWRERGGRREDLRAVVVDPSSPWTFGREEDSGLMYVERRGGEWDIRTQKTRGGERNVSASKKTPAEVVPMRRETNPHASPEDPTNPHPGAGLDPFRNNPRRKAAMLTKANNPDGPRRMPPKVGGEFKHGSECACWMCSDEAPAERVEVGASA